MAEDASILEWMRVDWNERARQDPYYYVAFAKRNQSTRDFIATAHQVLPILESELIRLPAPDSGQWRALEIGCGADRLLVGMSRHFRELHGKSMEILPFSCEPGCDAVGEL